MSARCNIHFTLGDDIVANIYRHDDGYPTFVLQDLPRFFDAVQAQCDDPGFDDAAFLASKFVVWQAARNIRERNGGPLDFMGIGIDNQDAGDSAYIYTVNCDELDSRGQPTVTWEGSE